MILEVVGVLKAEIPAKKTAEAVAETLASLKKELLFQAPLKTRKQYLGAPGAPDLKIKAGQLVEVLGKGSFSWVIQFLGLHASTRVVWVNSLAIELFPVAVAQESLALSRILFIEKVAAPKAGNLFMTLLRSKLFQVVVLDQALIPRRNFDVQMRKLQLVAEECEVVLVMLSQQATQSFTVNIQVDTENEIRLRKVKGGTL